MNAHLPSLNRLVSELGKLPGIGPKSALRMAYYVLKSSEHFSEDLALALRQVKKNTHLCPQCFAYTEEEEVCKICSDLTRSHTSICVVESPSDRDPIESSGVFKGCYHVLHGTISPLEGVGPKDLKIQALMNRIYTLKEASQPVEEIILALDADIEGDITVLYLSKILREKEIKVTRIAHGVPIGGDIDYIDHRTLGRALENRVQL